MLVTYGCLEQLFKKKSYYIEDIRKMSEVAFRNEM